MIRIKSGVSHLSDGGSWVIDEQTGLGDELVKEEICVLKCITLLDKSKRSKEQLSSTSDCRKGSEFNKINIVLKEAS